MRVASKGISPSVRILCDRVHHEKNSNPTGHGPVGPSFPFFARYDTDIIAVARRLRCYYRNVIIAKIASSGIFIPGCGE